MPEGTPVPDFFSRYQSTTRVITNGSDLEKFDHWEDPNPKFTVNLAWNPWLQGDAVTLKSFGGWVIGPIKDYGEPVLVEAVTLA